MVRRVFDGEIAGIGTTSGHRLVVGNWPGSPYGPVADVMIEAPDGRRTLLASGAELAAFLAATYVFDDVRVVPVQVRAAGSQWRVAAGPLLLTFRIGSRGTLGRLLRAIPSGLAAAPAWAALLDLPARTVLPGVRTRGSTGSGRREWYGARDLHPIVAAVATLEGVDLGELADVRPPVRFGFGSVPRRPALVRVTTTVEVGPA